MSKTDDGGAARERQMIEAARDADALACEAHGLDYLAGEIRAGKHDLNSSIAECVSAIRLYDASLAPKREAAEKRIGELEAMLADPPIGAIENGRTFARWIEEKAGGRLPEDWPDFVRCFEFMAAWVAKAVRTDDPAISRARTILDRAALKDPTT